MKLPTSSPTTESSACDHGRRRVFRLAAAMAGVILLPRAALCVSAAEVRGPGVRLARVGADGRLARAPALSGGQGAWRLRVRAAEAQMPFALEASYGEGITHRFWHAWRDPGGTLAQSHLAAVTCRAHAGGLRLSVRAGGEHGALDVPALAGDYVLAIAAAGQAPPAIERFQLAAPAGDCRKGRLHCRDSQVPTDFSHVVLSLEPVAVDA